MPPRKKPPPKRAPGRTVKAFSAPFKTPSKTKAEDDFDKFAETPGTPVHTSVDTHVADSNTPIVAGTRTPAPTPKPKAPRARGKRKINETTEAEEKTPANPRSRRGGIAQTPQSEGTKRGNVDFDSLAETPGGTPVSAAGDDEFEGLGDTPASIAPTPASEPADNECTSGRSKRRRTQTAFFGEAAKEEDVVEETRTANRRKRTRPPSDTEDSESDSEYENCSDSEFEGKEGGRGVREGGRRVREGTARRSIELPPVDPNRELMTGELPFIPGFEHNPCWGSDGVAIWVKPHPIKFINGNRYTPGQILESRYHSPGPPVCPIIIRGSCHGRFPPDEMMTRVALRVRVSYHRLVRRVRREFVRGIEEVAVFMKALRLNIIPRSEENKRRGLSKLVKLGIKTGWDTMRFLDCVEYLSEIFASKFVIPEYEGLVDHVFEMIATQVLRQLDSTKLIPKTIQTMERKGIPWTGEHVISNRRTMVINAMTGPPFLTEDEWRIKWRCERPKATDEELTRKYDSIGNVIGHFAPPPTLRELTTPLEPFDWLEESDNICNMYRRRYYSLYPKIKKKDMKRALKARRKLMKEGKCKSEDMETATIEELDKVKPDTTKSEGAIATKRKPDFVNNKERADNSTQDQKKRQKREKKLKRREKRRLRKEAKRKAKSDDLEKTKNGDLDRIKTEKAVATKTEQCDQKPSTETESTIADGDQRIKTENTISDENLPVVTESKETDTESAPNPECPPILSTPPLLTTEAILNQPVDLSLILPAGESPSNSTEYSPASSTGQMERGHEP